MRTPKPLLAVSALGVFLVALAGGCATSPSFEVKVHSIARTSPTPQKLESYRIQPRNPDLGPDSLRYKETVQHIKTALSGHGMFEAPTLELADLIVEIDYGIEPARASYHTESVPIFSRPTAEAPDRELAVEQRRQTRNVQAADSAAPRLIGYEEVTVPVVVREKHLSVAGRANRALPEGQPPFEVFRVTASIEDDSSDLRRRLPVLASAVMDQIGRTTNGLATATVNERDEAVSLIKRGL